MDAVGGVAVGGASGADSVRVKEIADTRDRKIRYAYAIRTQQNFKTHQIGTPLSPQKGSLSDGLHIPAEIHTTKKHRACMSQMLFLSYICRQEGLP